MRILVLLFLCVLTCSPALACTGKDVNTFKKVTQLQKKDFDHYDMNKDGQVTVGEYVQTNSEGKRGGKVNVHLFIKHDVNKSGAVTFEEWKNFHNQSHYSLDHGVGCEGVH